MNSGRIFMNSGSIFHLGLFTPVHIGALKLSAKQLFLSDVLRAGGLVLFGHSLNYFNVF